MTTGEYNIITCCDSKFTSVFKSIKRVLKETGCEIVSINEEQLSNSQEISNCPRCSNYFKYGYKYTRTNVVTKNIL